MQRPSIVIFIFLYAFQRYCGFCAIARTPLFSTPPLVCPKVPRVLLRMGGWPLCYDTKIEGAGLIVCAIRFQDFLIFWSWSTNVTYRRTGRGQTTCYRNTTLCTIVHRMVKIDWHPNKPNSGTKFRFCIHFYFKLILCNKLSKFSLIGYVKLST